MGINKIISVDNLSFKYNNKAVFENVSINIFQNKLTFILGENGSGKSTFIKLLVGLLDVTEGNIFLKNKEIKNYSFIEKSKIIGLLKQSHKSVFPFKVVDVVLTGLANKIKLFPTKKDYQLAYETLEKVGISYLSEKNYCELSGGEQQLVMITRLIAQDSEIFILDEPTAHLDLCFQSKLLSLLKSLLSEGKTIISVVHDPNLAFIYGDDFLFVDNKKVFRVENGTEPWNENFIKSIYKSSFKQIDYLGKKLIIPDFN